MSLEGRIAVVIGGGRGIGRTYCEYLLSRGAKVAIADILPGVGENLLKELQDKYDKDNMMYSHCDVTDEGQVEGLIEFTKFTFQGLPTIFVISAGVIHEYEWKKTLHVNLYGTIAATNVAMKFMSKKHGGLGGDIVLTASIGAVEAYPIGPVYCATKAGVLQFTRCWGAMEHYEESGLRVNCICPSPVNTLMVQSIGPATCRTNTPVDFPMIEPSVVGEALLKLLDDKKTGQALLVLFRGTEYVKFTDYKPLLV